MKNKKIFLTFNICLLALLYALAQINMSDQSDSKNNNGRHSPSLLEFGFEKEERSTPEEKTLVPEPESEKEKKVKSEKRQKENRKKRAEELKKEQKKEGN